MAVTRIIVQQMIAMDQTDIITSKYPRYTVNLGNSISSITAGELTSAVDKAAASAAAAKASEIAAKGSENSVKADADRASTAATKSENSALRSEQAIELAQAEAERSEAAAGSSEAAKTVAQQAADNASQSKLLAEQAKAAAEAAATDSRNSATAAKTSETNAAGSAGTAKGHADKAAASATAAKISETNAAASATAAAGSATTAGSEALTAEQEADRAKAEADRASQVVNGKLDSTDIAPFVKLYKTLEEAQADLTHRNEGERILVWSKTASKYGWYKVTTDEGTKSLTLELEEPRLLSVNNVQPDEAGNVQVTIPGGNPSLWLGEVTLFPYSKDSGVGYSGILPADGRLVLRVDYPDAWEAVDKGLVPSVTEEEWQAGAVMYFSRGTDDTNFRLPDMMRGQAFRAPVKNEEDAGEVKEQTPYVALVNNVAPDDTGNVTVDVGVKTINGAAPGADGNIAGIAKSGANKDITSLTGLTSPITAPAATKATELATLGQVNASASDTLEKVWENAKPLDNSDLDTVFEEGPYFQHSNANATDANHYPMSHAGSLLVLRNAANNALKGVTQLYYPYSTNRTFRRTFDGAALVWGAWEEYYLMGRTIDYSALPKEAYSSVRLGTTEMGGKTYLRKFRGGGADAIFHETVQGGLYRIAAGVTDVQTVFSVDYRGGNNTVGYLGDKTIVKDGSFGIGTTSTNGMTELGWTSGFLTYATNKPEVPANVCGWQACYGSSRRAQIVMGTDGRLWSRFSMSATLADADTPWKELPFMAAPNVNFASGFSVSNTQGSQTYVIAAVENKGRPSTDNGSRVAFEIPHTTTRPYLLQRRNDGTNTGQIINELPTATGALAVQGTSGREYKRDISDADATEALNRINQIRFVNYVYKDDEQNRERFGFIAEEVEQIAPQYIKHMEEPVEEIADPDTGEILERIYRDRPCVDNNPIVMDLLGAVHVLSKTVDAQKSQIDSLTKQVEDLTAAVKILLGNSK